MHAQVQFGGLEVLNEPTDGLYFLVNHLLDSFPKTPPASLLNNSQKRHDFTTLHMPFNSSPATSSSTWSSTLSESSELIFHENEVTPGRRQCGLAGPDCNIIRKRKKEYFCCKSFTILDKSWIVCWGNDSELHALTYLILAQGWWLTHFLTSSVFF